VNRIIATFFYTGLAPVAPGTVGSLAAIPAWFLLNMFGWPAVLIAVAILIPVGIRSTALETQGSEDHDPSRVVIDEVVGQWIALLPISIGLIPLAVIPVLLAFGLFRLFDITKLGPIGWADRMSTPTGVMLDDVIAGIFAAIVLALIGVILW